MDGTETLLPHNLALDYTRESIKLVRTTRSYTWEIKIMPTGEMISMDDIKRVERINNDMKKTFLGEDDQNAVY